MAVGKTYLAGSDGLFRVYNHETDVWSDYTGFTTADLFDVKTDTANPDYAIICGLNYFAYTVNAGVTVVPVTPPLGAIARAFQISIPTLVNDVVYICGSGGGSQAGVIKSIDGGITYTLQITGLSALYGNQATSLYFKDVNVGVLAHGEAVAKTIDGAANWTYLNGGSAIAVGEIVSGVHISADEQVIIAVTDAGIYRSANAGVSFTSVYTYVDPDYNGQPLKYCHLSWYNDDNMWVSGNNGPILYTADAGLTWSEVFPGQTIGDDGRSIFGSHFYSLDEGFFTYDKGANNEGLVYKAADANTTIVNTPSTDYFATGSIGYAVWTLLTTTYCGCPNGYVYNPGTGECEQTVTIAATYSGDLLTLQPGSKSTAYSKYGARLYEDITNKTYPIVRSTTTPANLVDNNGSGSIVGIYNNVTAYGSIRSTLWGYDSSGAIPACGTGDTGGRLNTVGIKILPTPILPNYLCFEYCITINTTKQYLVAFAADNYGKLYIDGVEVIKLSTTNTKNFDYWHIFPITLVSGQHTIKICGSNQAAEYAFGAEIYNISASEFVFNDFLSKAALNSADCGNIVTDLTNGVNSNGEPILIFSTFDFIGQEVPDPAGTGTWSCEPGWELNICNGIPNCQKVITTEYNDCCYDLINCSTEEVVYTVSTANLDVDPLINYVGSYITIDAFPECLFVQVSSQCSNATLFSDTAVITAYETCQSCNEIAQVYPCYLLTNCNNPEVTLYTEQDLSSSSGKVVEVAEYPGLCWTVLKTFNCPGPFSIVQIVDTYDDCECCFQYQCV